MSRPIFSGRLNKNGVMIAIRMTAKIVISCVEYLRFLIASLFMCIIRYSICSDLRDNLPRCKKKLLQI